MSFAKGLGEKVSAEKTLSSAAVFTTGAVKNAAEELSKTPSDEEQVITEVIEAGTEAEEVVGESLVDLDDEEPLEELEDLDAEPLKETPTEEVVASKEEESKEGATPTVQEVEEEEVQPPLVTQPSVVDTNAFQQLTRNNDEVGPEVSGSYAEVVESMVSQQCQLHGIKNLDLTTFGLRAQVISFPNLSIMTFGNHKFLGAPFTQKEEDLIIHRLAVHMATTNKERVVVRAVQEIKDERGLSYYSLLFTESIARRFADMFEYKVFANVNEADVSKLVLVIQK